MASTPSPSRGCAVSPRSGPPSRRASSPPRRLARRTRIVAARITPADPPAAAPPRVVDASDRRASSATAPSRGRRRRVPLGVAFAAARRRPGGPRGGGTRPRRTSSRPSSRASTSPHSPPRCSGSAMILARTSESSLARGASMGRGVARPRRVRDPLLRGLRRRSTSPARWRRRRSSGRCSTRRSRRGTGPTAPSTGPLDGFRSMLENPNFVTEEWAHVLAWDFFVGRWMWLDAVERDVPSCGRVCSRPTSGLTPGAPAVLPGVPARGKGLPPPTPTPKRAARKAPPSPRRR